MADLAGTDLGIGCCGGGDGDGAELRKEMRRCERVGDGLKTTLERLPGAAGLRRRGIRPVILGNFSARTTGRRCLSGRAAG